MPRKEDVVTEPFAVEEPLVPTVDPKEVKPEVSAKKREYIHVPSGEKYELSDEDYADMKANPDRWLGLPCPRSGTDAPIAIGPHGEIEWASSGEKVDPYNMPE